MPNVLRLTCLNGNLKGNQWDIVAYARVGRGDNLELTLPDASVSRMHAVLDSESGWRAIDLKSTNGTYLNGIRLGRSHSGGSRPDSILLQDRDILQFGKVAIMVELRNPAEISKPRTPSFPEQLSDGTDPGSSTRHVPPTILAPLKPTTPEEAWFAARTRHPGLLVLIRVGDYYESFHEDADRLSAVCGLPLLTGKARRCRFPARALDECLDKLMYRNLRMVVCNRTTEIRVGEPQECLHPCMP